MSTTFKLPLFVLAASLLIAGCGRDHTATTSPGAGGTNSSEAMERAEVAHALAESPEAVDDGSFESPDEWTTSASTSSRVEPLEAIRPFRWWRTIRDVETTFEFAFADTDTTGRPTRAVVTVHKKLTGGLHILAGPADQDSVPRDSLTLLRKPLVDHWVRRVLLRRVRTEDDSRVRWRIAAVSGVEVTSRDAQTDILSLRVQTASQDTTIEDPLAFWNLRRIVKVTPGEDVTLTVTTAASDDVVVLISRAGRFRFHSNGDNTYSGHWRAPAFDGLRHVGVNALSHGTLFDDDAPYDSKAWILPYVVTGQVLADYLPRQP